MDATDPKINDHSAILDIDDAQLQWVANGADAHSIPFTHIIAAIPSSTDTAEYTLLYTAASENKTEDAHKDANLLFKSATLSRLPRLFLGAHVSDQCSFWRESVSTLNAKQAIHVVVSTGSGTGLATGVWERLLHPLLNLLGLAAKVHFTTSENSVVEFTKGTIFPIANAGGSQLVIVLSGDGGIVDAVNALLSEKQSSIYRRPTLALLPLGTGNALANSTVLGEDKTMGLRTLIQGSARELPLFRATFSPGARLLVNEGREEQQLHGVLDGKPVAYGAVVCSWGLHATLVADSDTAEYRKFGAERFKMAANEALFPSDGSLPHAYRGRVSVSKPGGDGWIELPKEEHGYVLATLVSQLEAGFTISPDSRPLDGKLRLIYFGRVSGKEAMEIMTEAYQGGKHKADDRVVYEEISGLRIHFDEEDARWRRVCIDGKIIRVEKGGWIEVLKEEHGVVDLIARKD